MNRGARLICNLEWRDRVTPSLISLHLLPIKARIQFKYCLVTHKTLKLKDPAYLFSLLVPYSTETTMVLRSRGDDFRLTQPRSLNNWGDRSFQNAAPRIYNMLPVNIKEAPSIETFKNRLKTYLFKMAYNLEEQTINPNYKTRWEVEDTLIGIGPYEVTHSAIEPRARYKCNEDEDSWAYN